jgi:hypothetical protein
MGPGLLGVNPRVAYDHDGNIASNRIDSLAFCTFQTLLVSRRRDRRFAFRANQNVE